MSLYESARTDDSLRDWAANFLQVADTDSAHYGLTEALLTAFQTLLNTFIAKLTLTRQVNTATVLATAEKNEAREALIENARLLVSIVNGQAGVTDAEKLELGITVRQPATPSQLPPYAPMIDARGVDGNVVHFLLHNSQVLERHGRPPFAQGAAVYSFVGPVPPIDHKQWRFEFNATKTRTSVAFPASVEPGTKVWISAAWYNVKGEGPMAFPLETHVMGTPLAQAGAQEESEAA